VVGWGGYAAVYIRVTRARFDQRTAARVGALVEQINQAYASLFTTFVAHANRVGYEDGCIFGADRPVYDPNGELLAKGPITRRGLTLAEVDMNQLPPHARPPAVTAG